MKISICIATYNDDRLPLTVQAIRHYQRESRKFCELVIADNAPVASPYSAWIKKQVEGPWRIGMAGSKYVSIPDVASPCRAKNAAIAAATGDAILMIDAHILLPPMAITRLIDMYERNPKTMDLFHGPLMHSSFSSLTTHLNDEFRGASWGTSGEAWQAPDGTIFSVMQTEDKLCRFVQMAPAEYFPPSTTTPPPENDPYAGQEGRNWWKIPEATFAGKPESLAYEGRGNVLKKLGFKQLGWGLDDFFEIPGAYTGLFSCRREAWIPFHEDTAGFGGGDFALQSRFRTDGRKVWCCGFLRWWHDFRDNESFDRSPGRTVKNQIHNLYLNGADKTRLRQHYVGNKLITDSAFDEALVNIMPTQSMPRSISPVTPTYLPENAQTQQRPAFIPPTQPTQEQIIAAQANIALNKVGDELFMLFDEAEVPRKPNCQCNEKRIAMNMLGIDGCEENRDRCIGWLKDSSAKLSLVEKAKAGLGVIKAGFMPNPLDIYGSLFDEGIRRAKSRKAAAPAPAPAGKTKTPRKE